MDTLTPANYFEHRDDCSIACPIAAGFRDHGVRHQPSCAIVADTGHHYREAVAVEAERLRDAATPRPRAYLLVVGRYADEQVVGVHITDSELAARAVATRMTLDRLDRHPSDLVEVRAEPVALIDSNADAITHSVRLEIQD